MFHERRQFKIGDETIRTPLVVPSFSSRAGGQAVSKIIDVTKEFVGGVILVSAYDVLRHKVQQRSLSHATHIFLDSGGYEAGADADLSEAFTPSGTRAWSIGEYRQVLEAWDYCKPTVLVNFDSPHRRESLDRQIARAQENRARFADASHVFLAKPEPAGTNRHGNYLDVGALVPRLRQTTQFDIIAATEKELGDSLIARLANVARLRAGLSAIGSNVPIHVFGSLDPIATPLFFLAGADIFDGLTWLRYAYHAGSATYRQNILALDNLPPDTRDGDLAAHIHLKNFHALGRLRDEMIRFAQTDDFEVFGQRAGYFRMVSDLIAAEVKQ